jgi:hypothetical protein
MARRISRDADDRIAGLTFHNSPMRMQIPGMSFLAMQRLFDEIDLSLYRCPECRWAGRGRDLAAMEHDASETYAFVSESETWYCCPQCEHEIAIDQPLMRLVVSNPEESGDKVEPGTGSTPALGQMRIAAPPTQGFTDGQATTNPEKPGTRPTGRDEGLK